MKSKARPLEICIDGKYFIDGADGCDRRGDNADLWGIFYSLLKVRGGGHVHFVKLMGHTSCTFDFRQGVGY